MNTKSLEQQVWDDCLDHGYFVRSTKADGLASWQSYKQKYSQSEFSGKAVQLKQNFIEFALSLKYEATDKDQLSDAIFQIDGVSVNNAIDTEHFLVQHFRIPLLCNFELPIVKWGQLAYNVGQFLACLELQNVYDSKIIEFYKEHDLGNMDTFFM